MVTRGGDDRKGRRLPSRLACLSRERTAPRRGWPVTIADGAAHPRASDAIAAGAIPRSGSGRSAQVQPAIGGRGWLERLYPEMPVGGWRAVRPIIVTAIAAALYGCPTSDGRAFAFDETYTPGRL